MNKPLRFGVLGTGRITRRLVADLQSSDDVTVTAIGSRMASRARWSADQYGIAAAVDSYQGVIDRDDVDAVYIATAPSDHAALAIAAAGSGKHVLCEKPLSVDLASTMAVADAFRSTDAIWLDATAWLHHERTEAFWRWMNEGRFGRIGHVSASVSFYRPFQSDDHRLHAVRGGGCRLDLGWYAAGLLVHAAGMPHRVTATALMENDVEIRVMAMMQCDNDVTATISCGYDTASRKWFEIAGSEASLICDDFTRPWPDRPARCWIHDASGSVESESFEGSQERRMIARFRDAAMGEPIDVAAMNTRCLQTASVLDAIAASCRDGVTVQPQTATSF